MYWKIIRPLTCRTFVNTFLMNLLILFHHPSPLLSALKYTKIVTYKPEDSKTTNQ